MNGGGLLTVGHILRDLAELRSCVPCPGIQIGLTLDLVGDLILTDHAKAMLEGSRSQGRIPLELLESLFFTYLVSQSEQLLRLRHHDLKSAGSGGRRGGILGGTNYRHSECETQKGKEP